MVFEDVGVCNKNLERNRFFAINSDFFIPTSLKPDFADL